MLAKLKSRNFIDSFTLELATELSSIKAVLTDEVGKVYSILETDIPPTQKHIYWDGLNELPYGIYLLELSCEAEQQKMTLVKRI